MFLSQRRKYLGDMMQVFANGVVIITLQYLSGLNQHIAHLKLAHYSMSIISQYRRGKPTITYMIFTHVMLAFVYEYLYIYILYLHYNLTKKKSKNDTIKVNLWVAQYLFSFLSGTVP